MNTPICDFVENYIDQETVRAHMPGHKGEGFLGVESLDITEIKGADSLFEASSIIKESEDNAGMIFGAHTYYSAEGSSLSIRAMLYLTLLYAKEHKKEPLVLAARNVHNTFLSSVALLDLKVEWLYSDDYSYLSCKVSADTLDEKLSTIKIKPVAFYITSPDYLGNIADIKAIAQVCKKHDVLLLVDNAHGAYLKFLKESQHPIDLGATMCCDSAHKTLPVITGGAYLHISENAPKLLSEKAKKALSLFASTSPSYLILQSLDMANKVLSDGYKEKLNVFISSVKNLKNRLENNSYILVGDESLKITIDTKSYGYSGTDFAQKLREEIIECEFCDPDFVVMMLSPSTSADELAKIESVLLSIEKKQKIDDKPPVLVKPKKAMTVREAVLSISKTVDTKNSVGKILAQTTLSCPPAVPIVVSGEIIDESALRLFEYYGIERCDVVDCEF